MRFTKEIKVFQAKQYGGVPTNLREFVKWINKKVSLVPLEYLDNARIYFDAYTDYVEMKIIYNRPETDEEVDFRLGQATV